MKAPFELFEVLPGRYNIGPKINHLWDTLRYIPVPLDRLVRELLLKIKWFPTLTFALHRVMKPTLVLKKVRTTWTISVHIAKSIWCFNHCWESPIYGQQKDRIQWTKKHMVKKVRFLIFVLMRKNVPNNFTSTDTPPKKKLTAGNPKIAGLDRCFSLFQTWVRPFTLEVIHQNCCEVILMRMLYGCLQKSWENPQIIPICS